MIDASSFRSMVEGVSAAGYGDDVAWAEGLRAPSNPDEFAREAIYVICNSGMRFTVARGIYDRVMTALRAGRPASSAFGHVGKAAAIQTIWERRAELYWRFVTAPDPVAFCESLPWVGAITKFHLAKNLGADVAKPDVHLQRLADREGTTAQALCERLAAETGFKVATVDTVLWRACAIGLISSRAGQ